MSSKKKNKSSINKIEQEEKYIEFLKKRLNSDNFKNNVTKEEYELTKKKYDKSKLKLKFLKESNI